MCKFIFLFFVVLVIKPVIGISIETNTLGAFRYLGFPSGSDMFQCDADILSAALPSNAIWEKLMPPAEKEGTQVQNRLKEQRSFWQKRMILRAFAMEKAFYQEKKDEFFYQMEQLSEDFKIICKDVNREILLGTASMYYILESLLRIQESKLPQRRWLSQELLQSLIPQSCFSNEDSSGMKQTETYWHLFLLANAIVQYHDTHGRLPHDLSEIEGRRIDAWGRPILYLQDGDRWFFKSLGENGVDKAKYDIDNRMPLFITSRNPILYNGMSEDRITLWMNQELQVGTVLIRLADGMPQFIRDSQGEVRFAIARRQPKDEEKPTK